ncbi:hypothetical protein JCGZ_17123 [Jatropha curcas]|uniref:Aminotransferase-like plant mobile domain-containing protein n=1 Tax=Jatropha curcas TaxID=180498 RepID=A0A067K5Y8_JATCU|nr:hypothetical protein JCGZ_17123 [Jatropha curcas]
MEDMGCIGGIVLAETIRSLDRVALGFDDWTVSLIILQVWAYEYCVYPGGPSGDTPPESRRIPRYLAHCHHTYASGEDPEYWRCFLNDRSLSDFFLTPWDCDAWRTYPDREVAELHTRSRFLMWGYWADRYYLGERVYDTPVAPAQRRVPHAPPRHICLLEGMTREDQEVEYKGFSANDFLSASDFPVYFSSRMQARLPEILEYTQEWKTHKTAAHYRAEAAAEAGAAVARAGSAGVVLGDVPFPPGMEVVLNPDLGLGSGIIIPADLRQAPPPVQLDPEHTTHSSKLGLIGLKSFDLATYSALVGFVGSSRFRKGILEARFDRPERCQFYPEIPASAYTPEMETLGALPDIPTFDGEPVPVSRNQLIPGTRPLQLLPLPGTEFPVNLGKARSGGSATDASAFWDLLDPPIRALVVATGFGDYAAGLRRTQPRFSPAMRYALMERWNDCTHTFVFGFGEMTLTPVDYAAITGLCFIGPVPPLDARYQTATLGAQLVRSLLGVTSQTRYTVQGCMSYEMVFRF